MYRQIRKAEVLILEVLAILNTLLQGKFVLLVGELVKMKQEKDLLSTIIRQKQMIILHVQYVETNLITGIEIVLDAEDQVM